LPKILALDDALLGQKFYGSIEILRLIGKNQNLPRRCIVSQYHSPAVKDPSSWSNNRNSPQSIVLCKPAPFFSLDDLEMCQFQVEQSQDSKNQNQNHPGAVAKKNRVSPDLHYRSRRARR